MKSQGFDFSRGGEDEPYARLDVFGLSLPKLVFVFLRRGLHFPKVLRYLIR